MSDNGGYTVPIITETSQTNLEDMHDQQRDHIACEFNPSPSASEKPSADSSFVSVDSKLDSYLNKLENILNNFFFVGHETPKPWYLNFSGIYGTIKNFADQAILNSSLFEYSLSVLESATAFSNSRLGFPATGSFVDIFANYATTTDENISKLLVALDHRFDEARITVKKGCSIVIGGVIQQAFWLHDFVQQSQDAKDPSKVISLFQTPLELARIALSYLHEKFPDAYDMIELVVCNVMDLPAQFLRYTIRNAWLLKVALNERKDFLIANISATFHTSTHFIDHFFYRQAVWLLRFFQPFFHAVWLRRESINTFFHPLLVIVMPFLEPIFVKALVIYRTIQENSLVGPIVTRIEDLVLTSLNDAGMIFTNYNGGRHTSFEME